VPADTSYSTGQGTVYSWIEVHRPIGTIRPDEVPCTIATIELDEGFRLLGRLDIAKLAIGTQVRAIFIDHPDWTELAFTAAESDDRNES